MKMYSVFYALVVSVFFTTVLNGQNTVSIDVTANQSPISPYIYGANDPTVNASAIRWGGNRTSSYNWENNYSNAGKDYNFMSDTYFTNGMSSADQDIPAIPIIKTVQTANERKQYTLVTLQAAGYVAADKNGVVTEAQIAPSSRWAELSYKKNSPYHLSPDLTDGKVYIDELVHYLNQVLGSKGNGGVDAFAVDNEPALWASNHARMRTNDVTPEELFEKTTKIGTLVKELSPNADVYSGVFYGWSDLRRLRMSTSDFNAMKLIYGTDALFIDYFLDTLRKIDQSLGKRIVDVLDIHWYPEAKGSVTGHRIVDLEGTILASDLIKPDMIQARLQAPRSLWDSSYVENSYITQASQLGGPIMLLPRLKKSVDTYYPGTKLAFTEFKYDAENHFSGGLALVDVLGVFGREGVYMAAKWDPIVVNSYASSAYKLFLNYDNQGGTFGKTSVSCITNNNQDLSTFASLDEQGFLHIITVNKKASSVTTQFDVSHGYYSSGVVYGFDSNSAMNTIEKYDDVAAIVNGAFDYTLPPYSALHFVLQPIERTAIVKAQVVEPHASKILLEYSSPVSLVSEAIALQDFSLQNSSGVSVDLIAIAQIADNVLELSVASSFTEIDTKNMLSYHGESILGVANLPVLSQQLLVHNELLIAPMLPLQAVLSENGKYITLHFTKTIAQSTGNYGLACLVNSQELDIDSCVVQPDGYSLCIYPHTRILLYDEVFVENKLQTLAALDNTLASVFEVPVVNNGPNYSAVIDSVKTITNFMIEAYVDKKLQQTDFSNAGFVLFENGVEIPFTANYSNQKIVFALASPMFKEHVYTISYIDTDKVKTLFGGYLDGFESMPVQNNLKVTPQAVVIPARIQAEDYLYHNSNTILEASTDDETPVLAFVGNNNVFGYAIEVVHEQKYTFVLRHAGTADGMVAVKHNGVELCRIFVPKTGAWNVWKNSAAVVQLPVGVSPIELQIIRSGFNINWIEIQEGENPSTAQLLPTSLTDNSGTKVYLLYDRLISTLPQASELVVARNGKPIAIESFAYLNNDTSRVALTLASPVYKGDVVTVSYTNTSARTTNNGLLEPVTNFVIQNKSLQINVGIEQVLTSSLVYPIPAKAYGVLYVQSHACSNFEYALHDMLGVEYVHGFGMRQVEILMPQKGVYVLTIQCELGIETKKILVE